MKVRRLIDQLASEEEALHGTIFVAPCVPGGRVRARVAGLVSSYAPQPADFAGWALFRPAEGGTAERVEEAPVTLVGEYLRLLKPLRMRLARPLAGQTWLAYPANESDARQRFGAARPAAVHLVDSPARFEPIVARCDGSAWWFEETDRRADAAHADYLRDFFRDVTPPEAVRFPGLTPEMRVAYGLATQQAKEFFARVQRRRDQGRLDEALRRAGGSLQEFRDRGDVWVVEWITRDGVRHTSAIEKRDLTVASAGICLTGRDRDFDLQSLVGVMDGQW